LSFFPFNFSFFLGIKMRYSRVFFIRTNKYMLQEDSRCCKFEFKGICVVARLYLQRKRKKKNKLLEFLSYNEMCVIASRIVARVHCISFVYGTL